MKKILIGVPSLKSGGVEVSLIRFLKELIKDKNLEIDLLLLKKEGIYLKEVPSSINILEVSYDDDIYSYNRRIKDILQIHGVLNKVKFLVFRIKQKFNFLIGNYKGYCKSFLKHVKYLDKEYDLAIDYHGYANFMSVVISSCNASKKAMWIHDERNTWIKKINFCLDSYDRIFAVGLASLKSLLLNNPNLKDKTDIFYNMSDYQNIRKKALEKIPLEYDKTKLNIITIGRLEYQKGYDIMLKVAKILKEKKINYCWYIIGGGTEDGILKSLTKSYSLDDYVKFLGIISNPFPYLKNADMYVLTSRHEGYCLAILEAKILNKIVIATDIPSNEEQIKDSINGFLCNLDPYEFANKIIEVNNNKELRNKVEKNLSKENFDYRSEFKKLYDLM